MITRTSGPNLAFYQQPSAGIFTLLHARELLLQGDISNFIFQYSVVSTQTLLGKVNPCTTLDHKDIYNCFMDKEIFDWLQKWHDQICFVFFKNFLNVCSKFWSYPLTFSFHLGLLTYLNLCLLFVLSWD